MKVFTDGRFAGQTTPNPLVRSITGYSTRSVIVAMGFLLIATQFNGTTVAMIYSPTQIVIAADTLFIRTHYVGKSTRYPICKLRQAGNIFFASIGKMVDNPDTNFSLNNLGKRSILQGKGVLASAQRLMKIGEKPIRDTISWLRTHNPGFYNASLKGVTYPMEVVFAGFDSGQPVIADVYFSVEEKGADITVTSHLKLCPSIACPDTNGFSIRGHSDAFRRYMNSPGFSKASLVNNPVEAVQTIIGMEAIDDPDDVGKPIDVVTITPKGHTCSVKGKCDCK
jgi:hypothetical protein